MGRKNARAIVVALVTVAAVGLTGCIGRGQLAQQFQQAGSVTGADAEYVVATQDVAAGTSVSGTIHPARSATLTAQVQAKVTSVVVKEGDSVKEGDVLLRVDSRLQDNQLAQAESRYRAAAANRKMVAMTGLVLTRAQLQSALTQALAQQVSAQVNLRNFTDKDTSAQQVANLQEQVKQAEASLRSAQNNLKSLQDYDTSALQVAVADFGVNQAELNLSMAQTRLAVLQSRDATEDQLTQLRTQVAQAQSNVRVAQLRLQESSRNTLASDESIAVLEEQVGQAQLSLKVAQSNLDNAGSNARASESDIDLQRLQVQSSEVSLQNAEASYKTAVAGAGQKKLQIASAQEQVNQAQSSLTMAQNNLESTQKTSGARSNDLETLKAQVNQADAAVDLAKANLAGMTDTEQRNALQLQSAREQESQALLALSAQRLSSDNYIVKAPWSGSVLAVNVSAGDMVSPQTSLVKIADVAAWNVETYVDEVDILNVKSGQDAQITIDPYPDETFAGKVSYLGRTLVRTPEGLNSYSVKIRVTTPPATVVDGMSADATIILSTAKGVLAVPVESVIGENGKKYVMLISTNARNKAVTTKTEITVGLEGDDYVQVTTGLKAGDHIVRQPVAASQTTTSSGSPFGGGQ
ncbi:MAG: efflux RND transporter periplasmic adaptor subunit [Candidatus Cryosericum sp.]